MLSAAVGLSAMTLAERASVGVPSLLPLFETRAGYLLLAQGVAVLVCGVAVAVADLMPRRSTLAAVGAAAALAMLVHVLAGHADAAAPLRPLNLTEQWVHMIAVGAWIGGLAWLLLGIHEKGEHERGRAVARYSTVAGIALAAVLLTGLLRAMTEVSSIGNLLTTSYGNALLIKVGLVVVLASLGALNRFRLVPALASRSEAIQPFRRAAGSEVAVATGILAVTAVLVGLAPAFANSPRQSPSGPGVTVSGSDYATTVRVRLTVTPGTVGRNEFLLTVSEYDTGKQLANVSSVQLNLSLPARPSIGQSTLTLSQSPNGAWRGTAVEPSIAGDWNIEVVIQETANAVVVPLTFRALPPPSPAPG